MKPPQIRLHVGKQYRDRMGRTWSVLRQEGEWYLCMRIAGPTGDPRRDSERHQWIDSDGKWSRMDKCECLVDLVEVAK